MANNHTPAEQKLLEVFRDEVRKAEAEMYHKALVNVSAILGWLTGDPPPSIADLRLWVLNQFAQAAQDCPPDSTIQKHIAFYQKAYGLVDLDPPKDPKCHPPDLYIYDYSAQEALYVYDGRWRMTQEEMDAWLAGRFRSSRRLTWVNKQELDNILDSLLPEEAEAVRKKL